MSEALAYFLFGMVAGVVLLSLLAYAYRAGFENAEGDKRKEGE